MPANTSLPKFGTEQGEAWRGHQYGAVYASQEVAGRARLCVAVSEGGSKTLLGLASLFDAPFFLLYVLVVPRGRSNSGRYQSGELSLEELKAMFDRFGAFWGADGRHSIWVRCIPQSATLVYDRHNILYLYGDLPRFRSELDSLGYKEVDSLAEPTPHQHAYLPDFDIAERECVAALNWHHTELLPEDEK
jgi:hypothetical protein